MNELEYYKSLVTDEEVINALIKDSKEREGEVEKSRVRPNLQFFQRTVTNLVSSNNRIAVNQEKIIAKEKEKYKTRKPRKVIVRKKLPIDYIKEILSDRIEFVKPKDDLHKSMCEEQASSISHDSPQSTRQKKVITCKKTPFQQIREILTNNVDRDVSKKGTKKVRKRKISSDTPERKNQTSYTKDPEANNLSIEKTKSKRKHSRSSEERMSDCTDNTLNDVKNSAESCGLRKNRQSSESSEPSIISLSDDSSSE